MLELSQLADWTSVPISPANCTPPSRLSCPSEPVPTWRHTLTQPCWWSSYLNIYYSCFPWPRYCRRCQGRPDMVFFPHSSPGAGSEKWQIEKKNMGFIYCTYCGMQGIEWTLQIPLQISTWLNFRFYSIICSSMLSLHNVWRFWECGWEKAFHSVIVKSYGTIVRGKKKSIILLVWIIKRLYFFV